MAMLGSISHRFPRNHWCIVHRFRVGSASKEWRVWYKKHLFLPKIIVLLSWELMLRNSKTELIFDVSVLLQVEITRKVAYKPLLMKRELGAPGAHLLLIWSLDPLPAPFDLHAYDCWRLISCRRNLPVPHAPILQPTYKVDYGTNTSTLTSGKPESRSWSPSQARCNRVKWEVKQN